MPVLEDWRGHSIDVAVIGAGAAGLATAIDLAARRPDLSVLVLEAAGRLGGRALTLPDGSGIDLGCGWLHGGQDNVWAAIAAERGIAVDRQPAPWNRNGPDGGPRQAERQAARAALHDFFEKVDAQSLGGIDRPLGAFLEPGGRWNGFIGAVATYINGAELEAASTLDYLRYDPGRPPDWRLPAGYGRLIAGYGAPAPVLIDTPVTSIRHDGAAGVTLETPRGALDCRAVVVTVSSTCLAEDAIRFDPPLPQKREAAAGVPLGVANKIYLDLAEPEALPREVYMHGDLGRVATGAYYLRPFGHPWIEGYYGGSLAREIEALSPEAAADFARDELVAIFGSALRPKLSLRARSVWAGNPWARGSYSYARPGHADARAVLAAPVNDRLFFAGEACSPARFSTAHGAYETGVAAAAALAKALPR